MQTPVSPGLGSSSENIVAQLEKAKGLGEKESAQRASLHLEIRAMKRSSSKVVLDRIKTDGSAGSGDEGQAEPGSPSTPETVHLEPIPIEENKNKSPRAGAAAALPVLGVSDGAMLFGLPKLCKWFIAQNRPLNLLVKLMNEIQDPKVGIQTTKKLVGLSRLDVFTEKDILQWLVKNKFTAAASAAARIVELLCRDYVIMEVKKGIYRFMELGERQKARVEEEKLIEQKVQQKLAQLAKEQKKAQKKDKKGRVAYPVIGVDLATLMASQKGEYPTLEVPFLLVRFAADVIVLNGQKEEGIFRLSVGTEEVAQMVHQINSDNNYALVRQDPNIAAVMMKRYLRDLPEPLCADYDGALRLVKSHADDGAFNSFYDSLPAPNQAVIKFIANFIARMTRPEVVAATKMDIGNYAIVFTPGFLRSKSVDMAAMANSVFEQEFVVKVVTLVRGRFPDDSVGDVASVPKPFVPQSQTSQHDLRVLVTDTPETLRHEDLLKQAEERLKAARRDLKEAKEQEKKEHKDTRKVSLRKASLSKSSGKEMSQEIHRTNTNPTASPTTTTTPPKAERTLSQSAKVTSPSVEKDDATPPKPNRQPPSLSGTGRRMSASATSSIPTTAHGPPAEVHAVVTTAPPMPPLPPPPVLPPLPSSPAPVPLINPPGSPPTDPSSAALLSPRVPQTPFEEFLFKAKVLDYIDAFHDYGIETIDDLKEVEEDDLESIGLKKFYCKRLVKMIAALKEEGREGGSAGGVDSLQVPASGTPKHRRRRRTKKVARKKSVEDKGNHSSEEGQTDNDTVTPAPPATLQAVVHAVEAQEASQQDDDESSGDLSSPSHSPRSPGALSSEVLKDLSTFMANLKAEISAKHDTAVLRICRQATEKVLELVRTADADVVEHAESIQAQIVQLNAYVMQLLKSSYSEETLSGTMEKIAAIEESCTEEL